MTVIPRLASSRRAALLLGATLACWAAPAAADYKESYRKGIQAADHGQWGQVALYMKEAADEQGREGEKVRIYGMRSEPYLPHYYRGLALARAGNCVEALEQWLESESQGAVKSTSQYKLLVQGRKSCQDQQARTQPAAAGGAEQEKQAAARKAQERDEQEAAQKAADAAAKARQQRADEQRVREQQAAAARERAAAEQKARDQQAAEAQKRAAAEQKTNEQQAAQAKAAAENQRQLEARKAPDRATPPRPAGPPPELRAAARALFQGDYDRVVQTLAGFTFADPRAAVTAALLRSAARYALFLQGGEKDAGMRRLALLDASTCRRLDPKLTPDPKFFSPRFREFYGSAE